MCGPDDRDRYGRRPRMYREPGMDDRRDGRFYGPPGYDCDCRRPAPEWRDRRYGECYPPDDRYMRDRYERCEEECCCEDEGPAMLEGLAEELDGMVNEVMSDLVREKIMCALEARLGDKLDRLVEAVVDSHIDNLEDMLRNRRPTRSDLVQKFAEIILEDFEDDCCDEECCCESEADEAETNKDGEKKPE